MADLGGYLSVSRALDVAPNVTHRWGRLRAIPARRFPAVLALARSRGQHHITLEGLMAGYWPAQDQRAADRERKRANAASRAAA